jgi:NAD(P)-dependent dehydrogenase (short-subunit alcohol dehydrogenase family)
VIRDLEGKVAVVTGASSGIGRATALRLAGEGCALALVDIDEGRLEETARLVEAAGVRSSLHLADVSDASRMEALPGEVVQAHGRVHILVNNAGVSVLKSFEDHSLEDFQWLIGINFWGVVHGCKFFLPVLREADEAHIVNVSSMFGFIGVPGQSSYCASKFAIRGFTESLWAELRQTSIGVTSVHPGGVATGIARSVRVTNEEARDQLHQTMEKYGHPADDVAGAILRGIRGNKLRVRVGVESFAVDWLKRLVPIGFHKVFAERMRVPGS